MSEQCTWCGEAVEPDDGFRAYEPAGERRAVFCRLEHIVPWSIQGPHWEPGRPDAESLPPAQAGPAGGQPEEPAPGACSYCGTELDDTRVLLIRHRGDRRIPDAFCGAEHMLEWAKAGGRYG